MPPVDFWYVLVKRSFFQNMKRKKIWHHLNTLKPGPELSKIEAVCQPDWLSICHYGFWKYYIVLFSEAFCGCSYVCPILSHFCQPIKSYSHLKFWSAKFGSAFYQFFKLLYFGNRKKIWEWNFGCKLHQWIPKTYYKMTKIQNFDGPTQGFS